MRSLHVRLLVTDPEGDDAQSLAQSLRAAGHVVVSEEVATVPPGVAPAPEFVVTEAAALPVPESLEAAEARHLAAMLRFTRGNRRRAAVLLGIARSTLLAKIRKYRLTA